MKITCISFSLFLLCLFYFSNSIYAHTGSLDELGGHFRNKDCTYLLHEPTTLARQASTMQELISMIQKYNSNSCKNSLTIEKIDLGEYPFFAEDSPSQSENRMETANKLVLGQTYSALLDRCTDGDTAVFTINGTTYKTRFLFIDTPESTKQKEPYGVEASSFTCSFLKEGKITLETDGDSLFDKYNRLLAWVFVDGKLHQEEITRNGLVEDFYDYGDYKYEERIREAMKRAKEKEYGLYATTNPDIEKEENSPNVISDSDQTESKAPLDSIVSEDEIKAEERAHQKEKVENKTGEKKSSFLFPFILVVGISLLIIFIFILK